MFNGNLFKRVKRSCVEPGVSMYMSGYDEVDEVVDDDELWGFT